VLPKQQLNNIIDLSQFKKGLNTVGGYDTLTIEESPDSIDVIFSEHGRLGKRFGRKRLNGTVTSAGVWGYGLFNYMPSTNVHKLIGKFGATVYKMDDLDGTFDSLLTSNGEVNMHCAQSLTNLIICREDVSTVNYWNGTDAAASVMNPNAPNAKYPIDWEGYLLLAYTTGQPKRFYYLDNAAITTDECTDYFTIRSGAGDELTGWGLLRGRLYAFMKNSIHRVSYLGGSPLFDVTELITITGAIPRTIQNIILPNGKEVFIFLNWERQLIIFDGTYIQVVSDNIAISNGQCPIHMNAINTGLLKNAHSVVDLEKQLYHLFVPMGGPLSISHRITLNYKTMALYAYRNQAIHSASAASDSSGRHFIIGAGYNGHAYKLDIGNTDDTGLITAQATGGTGYVTITSANHGLENGDVVTIAGTTSYNGSFTVSSAAQNTFKIADTYVADEATGTITTAINEYYVSPKLGAAPSISLKKPRKMVLYFKAVANYTLTLLERLNFTRAWTSRATNLYMYNEDDAFLGVDFILGTSTLGSSKTDVRLPFDIPAVNNLYQFKLTSNQSIKKPWWLNKIEFIEEEKGIGTKYENKR